MESEPASVERLAVSELDYVLPEELIATRPVEPRSAARMMVVRVGEPDRAVEHRTVGDLPEYLESGDCLCFNTTSVLPARLVGSKVGSGGKIEGLYLSQEGKSTWRMMLKSNGRLRAGVQVEFRSASDADRCVVVTLLERVDGAWLVEVPDDRSAQQLLEEVGRTPLPPYILRARQMADSAATSDDDESRDRLWYQTVYADESRAGSVAAPTAGLHFTPSLLKAISDRGVERCDVTLHVGAGTFKPIEAEHLGDHPMHEESWQVDAHAMNQLISARDEGRRVIAVGTTSVRTLESLPQPLAPIEGSLSGRTDLLISPGYRFGVVDGMLTNFHLPRSTLLALVGAKLGMDRTRRLYAEAIAKGYRFYSYGDAMLLLP